MVAKIIDRMEATVIVVTVASITLIITGNVLSRYFFHISMASASELSGFFLVWLSMIAAASGFRHRLHSGVDVFVRLLPPRFQFGIKIFNHLVIIGFFLYLAYASAIVVTAQWKQGSISPALRLPLWIVALGILVGALLACVNVCRALMEDFAERRQ